jgi:hypothetical protein
LESDEVAIIAIKSKTSSSKWLFSKLSKHTCLMAKEGRKKVKSNTSSSLKYVSSDEHTLFRDNYDSSDDDNSLMRQVGARDELLEQQEELLVQERKNSEELKKLLALEKR